MSVRSVEVFKSILFLQKDTMVIKISLDETVHRKVKAGAALQGLTISQYLDEIAPRVEVNER